MSKRKDIGESHYKMEQNQKKPFATDKRGYILDVLKEQNLTITIGSIDRDQDINSGSCLTYTLGKTLGQGEWGIVKSCEKNQKTFAIKDVNKEPENKAFYHKRVLLTEAACYSGLVYPPHTNIIKCYEIAESPNHIYMLLKLLSDRSLEHTLEDANYDNDAQQKIFRQIVTAVRHVHQHGIIHGDLKLSNICFKVTDEVRTTPILIDFGMATYVQTLDVKKRNQYRVGEVFAEFIGERKPLHHDYMNLKTILQQLLTGRLDYRHGLENAHPDALDLLEKFDQLCAQNDGLARVLGHRWFSKSDKSP